MFIFCGLYSKAKQDEGMAGTLHVVVAEGNWRTFCQLFHKIIPSLLYVSVDIHQVVHSPTPLKPHEYLSGIANCLYILQYPFHPLHYNLCK